jgi:hypothetical protein
MWRSSWRARTSGLGLNEPRLTAKPSPRALGTVKSAHSNEDELDTGRKTFASGLLPELISVLRRSRPGDLVAVTGDEQSIGPELETWCRFTGNALLETTVENGRARWVFRYGAVQEPSQEEKKDNRPIGSRLWLYTNFDCNLHCDYCCVRSSPAAPRRELRLALVQRIAREAAELGVEEIFVTLAP